MSAVAKGNESVLTLTTRELEGIIAKAVTDAVKSAMQSKQRLPVRMTCVAAAKYLGISVRSFHDNYQYLKRYKGNSVYVLTSDLENLK